jgi:RNA recognition motif-containing protein
MKNIFIGNLDFQASETSIRQLFEPFGAVDRVNIVTDRDTGRPRGFAYVEMSDEEAADRAITELDGMELSSRPLKVNEARPKEGVHSASAGGASGRRW